MRRDAFQAIADPVRRDIIGLIAQEPLTVNEIAENFSITRPAVSKQIKFLIDCGLVKTHQKGRERYCEIQPEGLLPVSEWLATYQQLWETKLDSFESYLQHLQSKKKPDE